MNQTMKSRIIYRSLLLLFVLTVGSQIVFSQDRARVIKETRENHTYCESVFYTPFKKSCLKKLENQFLSYCKGYEGTYEEKKCQSELGNIAKHKRELSPFPTKMLLTFSFIALVGIWYMGVWTLPDIDRFYIIREIESSPATLLVIKTFVSIALLMTYTQLLKSYLWPKG